MKTIPLIFAASLAATALISGCASTTPSSSSYPASSSSGSYSSGYGVIDAIDVISGGGDGIGAGTVIGGVVGGVLGNQVGSGSGKDIATVAGAVGGAVVGHQMEKANRANTYRIRVRMDNGGYQSVNQDSANDLRVGDRARIENDRVYRY